MSPAYYEPELPRCVLWINGLPGMGRRSIAQCLTNIEGHDKAVHIDPVTLTDHLAMPEHSRRPLLRPSPGHGPTRSTDKASRRAACFQRFVLAEREHNRLVVFIENCMDDAQGRLVAESFARAAAQANRLLVPVYLQCEAEEHARRIETSERVCSLGQHPDRREAKGIDSGPIFRFADQEQEGMVLDVTRNGISDHAMEIRKFVNRVEWKRRNQDAMRRESMSFSEEPTPVDGVMDWRMD